MYGGGGPKSLAEIKFEKCDKDNSGSIDAKELQSLCYESGHYMDDAAVAAALIVLDKDGSGEVAFEEFQKWWKSTHRWADIELDEEKKAKIAQTSEFFKYYDKDQSGALNKDEFEELHKQLVASGYSLKEFASCHEEIDTSGDGDVNFNEFLAWMISMGAI